MVTTEVHLTKLSYYEFIDTYDSKNFWKAYKAASKDSNGIPMLVDGEHEAEAESLNRFFLHMLK